jgi:hypothetical protein
LKDAATEHLTSPRRVPIFDGHNDVLLRFYRRGGTDAPRRSSKGRARARAHGFTTDFLVDLIRAGLATAQTERAVAGGRSMQVSRMRITDAGRRALAELRWP